MNDGFPADTTPPFGGHVADGDAKLCVCGLPRWLHWIDGDGRVVNRDSDCTGFRIKSERPEEGEP